MSTFTASTKNFVIRYWVKNINPPVASRYIGAPIHPIRPKIVHMTAHRPKDTLWWRVSVNKILSHKRVVRSWCARRVRNAFTQAFRQQGFDRLGRRLPGSSADETNLTGLTGSLEIYIHEPCLAQSFEVVQKDASQLFGELMAHQATPKAAQASVSPKASTEG